MRVAQEVRTAYGYVYDISSHQVLAGVTVTLTPKSMPEAGVTIAALVTTTDAQGYYEFTDILGAGPDYIYTFQKAGYQTLDVDREIWTTTTGEEPRLDVELAKTAPFPWWAVVLAAAAGGLTVAALREPKKGG